MMNSSTNKLELTFFLLLSSLLVVFLPFSSYAQAIDASLVEKLAEGITVDLREPSYSNGVLTTEKGGVITAAGVRIQAMHLCYTRQLVNQEPVLTIEAEGELLVEFGEYIFVGDKLFYDFQKKEGVIYNGKTAIVPWFFGGERLELRPDGSYLIYNGYVTTSEKDEPEWGIYSGLVYVKNQSYLSAQNVQLRLWNYAVLWIPSLRANLNSIFDSPIRYRFRWGGRQGPRFGLTYEIFSWEQWKTFVRFDYRLTRGPGGGIETHYRSLDHKTTFRSINYLAKDSSLIHPHDKARYRFEGNLQKLMNDDKTNILLTYDKISDKDMPSNYHDWDFDFDVAERTQLLVRHQEVNWISNFYTRVRLNSFQTVKEELPTLEVHFKPFEFGQLGVVAENWASASYLDFKYSKYLPHVHNYCSTRFEYQPTLYRPFNYGQFLTLTPEIGAVTIVYGNSPEKEEEWLALGKVGCQAQTQLYRYYGDFKHIIEPYAFYRYYSAPTSSPHQHYIFDIEDGWTRLNYCALGIRNNFYAKRETSNIARVLSTDLYAYAFFDTDKIKQTIPRVYANAVFFSNPSLKHVLNSAWNLERHQIDHFNFRTEWTYSADFALAAEYRHRDSYCWRKVDPDNFFLDMFHSEKALRHSPLSDRRDTLLLHCFYRFHPNWAFEISSRQGWDRLREPSYLEYEIDLLTTIQTAWHLRFSFQHRENDNRFAMYMNVGLKKPDPKECKRSCYCYD